MGNKAPEIEITQRFFDQITRYNMVLKVDYLIVSNGLQHCCRIDYSITAILFCRIYPSIKIYRELPIAFLFFLIASYTMRDMRAMMFALSSSVSYESMMKVLNVVFPTVWKNNEPGIIICACAVGIAVGRTGLVSYHGFGWQHTFNC